MIPLVIIAFLIGASLGTIACYLANNDTIERIKTDALASQKKTSDDAYARGYMRGYNDKTKRLPVQEKTDTIIFPLILQ